MAFKNIRFPTGVKYGAVSGPLWMNDIARLPGGRRKVNQFSDVPLRKFRVERPLKEPALRRAFLNFIYVCGGILNTFRVKDFADYEVLTGEGVVRIVGPGQAQLVKRYAFASIDPGSPTVNYTKDIDIVLPVRSTLTLSTPGFGTLVEGTHWTTDYTTPSGIITAIGSPTPLTGSTTWTGEFDIHAAFETDKFQIMIDDLELFFAQAIELTEERIDE